MDTSTPTIPHTYISAFRKKVGEVIISLTHRQRLTVLAVDAQTHTHKKTKQKKNTQKNTHTHTQTSAPSGRRCEVIISLIHGQRLTVLAVDAQTHTAHM